MRLEKQKFMTWLKSKPPTEIVGSARDTCDCPLVNFYRDLSGSEASIQDNPFERHSYFISRERDTRRLPKWADSFVAKIDQAPLSVYGNLTSKVSAKVAMEILANVW